MGLDSLLSHWKGVRDGLFATMDKFNDADLEYVPIPGGWSVRELMLHIAHEEAVEMLWGLTRDLAEFPPAYPVENYATVSAIKELLTEVHASTERYLRSLRDNDLERVVEAGWGKEYRLVLMVLHVLEHEIHHRGELSLILGLLGRKGLDA